MSLAQIAVLLSLVVGVVDNAAAPPECRTKVTYSRVDQDASAKRLWTFAFLVKSDCANSTGHFYYEYEYGDGKVTNVEKKQAPRWDASHGNNFFLLAKEQIPLGYSVKKVRVIENTIQSGKR
jgi:hypothetical protein